MISVLDNNEVKLFENFAEYYLWFQEKLKMRLELVNKSSDKASLASVEALF